MNRCISETIQIGIVVAMKRLTGSRILVVGTNFLNLQRPWTTLTHLLTLYSFFQGFRSCVEVTENQGHQAH